MEIEIKILGRDDLEVLSHATPGVFDKRIDESLAKEFLNDPRHHIVVAMRDDKVIGFASAVHYVHPDKSPELWINEVSVAPNYRNQSIGKRLLDSLFALARKLNCKEAWVLTEPTNEAAINLYSSAGGQSRAQTMFSFNIPD